MRWRSRAPTTVVLAAVLTLAVAAVAVWGWAVVHEAGVLARPASNPTLAPGAVPVSPTTTPLAAEDQKQAVLAKAWKEYEANWSANPDAAISALEEIMRVDPDYREARAKLYAQLIAKADRLLVAGDRSAALPILIRARDMNPAAPDAQQRLASLTPPPAPAPTTGRTPASIPVPTAPSRPPAVPAPDWTAFQEGPYSGRVRPEWQVYWREATRFPDEHTLRASMEQTRITPSMKNAVVNEWKRGRSSFIVSLLPTDDHISIQDCRRSATPVRTDMDAVLREMQAGAAGSVGTVTRGPQITRRGEALGTIRVQSGTTATYATNVELGTCHWPVLLTAFTDSATSFADFSAFIDALEVRAE